MRRTVPWLGPATLALFLVSCSGGGADSPPVNFAGVWSLTETNTATATFVHCTGDLSFLEGVHVGDLVSAATVCTTSGPSAVTQSGHTVTVVPVTYSCDDGDYGRYYGGGTVNERHIDFQLNTTSSYYGAVGTDKYTGTKTSVTTFVLDEWQVSFSGSINGSCNFSPKLRLDGYLSSASRSPSEGRELPGATTPAELVPKLIRSGWKR